MLLGSSFSSAVEQAFGLVKHNWKGAFTKVLEDKISLEQVIGHNSKDGQFIDTGVGYHKVELELTPCSQGKDIENIIVSFKSSTRTRQVPNQLIQWESTRGQKNWKEAERIANVAFWEVNVDTSTV